MSDIQPLYIISAKYAKEMRNKVAAFQTSTKTKKSVQATFITTYGLNSNQYSKQLVQKTLNLNALYEKL